MNTYKDEAKLLPYELNYDRPQIPELSPQPIEESLWHTVTSSFLVLQKCMPIILFYLLSQVISKTYLPESRGKFLMEMIVIIIPTVIFADPINQYHMHLVNFFLITFVCISLIRIYKCDAHQRVYVIGANRPFIITLVRATINILATIYILFGENVKVTQNSYAISESYGICLKDMGIGLYVFSMGIVQRKSRRYERLKRNTCILLTLGLIRFICTQFFNIDQDIHEYGSHWNGFITMALTNIGGTYIYESLRSPKDRLFGGVAFMIFHQVMLHFMTEAIILNEDKPRDTLPDANREGIYSYSGFLALYLLSTFIGDCLRPRPKNVILFYNEALRMFKELAVLVLSLWGMVIVCHYTTSFSRVLCNTGYVVFVLAIATTMTFLAMLVFHVILNTLWFTTEFKKYGRIYMGRIIKKADLPYYRDFFPSIVGIMSRNGWVAIAMSYTYAHFWSLLRPHEVKHFEETLFVIGCTISVILVNYALQLAARRCNLS
ncbi:unnamed protein product [Ceratitis capitata]|uniref:Phosphatidylinositol-glycan biosynthesis class W protein n=1 Tax=Ceratitis capitata TaxID=7213 RepID=A0A811UNM2_CERCA|nr:unnamed protein product [Ceratitis capitata]